VHAIASDPLGEFTVSLAVVSWVFERFWGQGPATLLVPSLAEDGSGALHAFAAAPTQGHTVRTWLAEILARYETLLAASDAWSHEPYGVPLSEMADCVIHDTRVHASVPTDMAWQAATVRVDTTGVGTGYLALHFDAARCDRVLMTAFAEAVVDAFRHVTHRGDLLDGWSPLTVADQTLLRRWGTGDAAPDAATDALAPVTERLHAGMRAHPNTPALRCGDVEWTYAMLDGAAHRVTAALTRVAASHGPEASARAPIAICMTRGPWLIATILGVLRAGRAYVPLDPHTPAVRLQHCCQDAGVAALVTDAATIEGLPPIDCPVVLADDTMPLAHEGSPADVTTPTIHLTDLAYIIYTSGSTGIPKGCLIEHRQLAHYLTWAVHYYWQGRPATMALFSSVAFDMAVTTIFGPLLTGGTLVLIPESVGVDAALRLQFASGAGIDTVKLTPSHIVMLEGLRLTTSDVQLAIVGGEAMTAVHRAVLHRIAPQMRIVNEYGPTEATVGCVV
jgi:non-ribosomal peptide synthetase component F